MESFVRLVLLCTMWTAAESTTSFRNVGTTCDHVYGTPLGVFSEANLIECGRRCSGYAVDACNSILYNPVGKVCMLNSDVYNNDAELPDDCGFIYAVRIVEYAGCTLDWMFAGGRCYKFISKCLPWDTCKAECEKESEGAMLAQVFDNTTSDVMYDVLKVQKNLGGACDYRWPWIGVHDKNTEGVYMNAMNVPYPEYLGFQSSNTSDCGYIYRNNIYIAGCTYEWSCLCDVAPSVTYNVYGYDMGN